MRTTAAIRQARYRERRRRGARVARGGLEVDPASIRALQAAGVLPEARTDAELLRHLSALIDFLGEPAVAAAVHRIMVAYASQM